MNGVNSLIKRCQKAPYSFCSMRAQQKMAIYDSGYKSSLGTKSASTSILNFPASKTMGNVVYNQPNGIFATAVQKDYDDNIVAIFKDGERHSQD